MRRHGIVYRGLQLTAVVVCASIVWRVVRGTDGLPEPASATGAGGAYQGVLTFATPGNGDPFSPTTVQDFDLATSNLTVRFDGLDPSRGRNGEMAFVSRLAAGWSADHGIVVADTRDVPGRPLFVCKEFNWTSNQACGTPRLSPNGRLVAFRSRGGGGRICKNNYEMYWSDYVTVADRQGNLVASFEGYAEPEWLPDGRLLMFGTFCQSAGIWLADPSLRSLERIDGNQVSTPAGAPAVSPDGSTLAFVWNRQLWSMALTRQPELSQLTRMPKSVFSAAWSPDGRALAVLLFDVTMPVKTLVLFQPGKESSVTTIPLPVYPYGPISWR